MYAKRLTLLSLLAAALVACQDTPTPTSLVPNEPLLASVGMARFSDWSATGPDAFGYLSALEMLL